MKNTTTTTTRPAAPEIKTTKTAAEITANINRIISEYEAARAEAKKARAPYDLHLTTNHTGKMHNIWSLSTSCLINTRCQKYRNISGSICEKCFAHAMNARYSTAFRNAFIDNYMILTREIIPAEYLPLIPVLYFRFESFGDLQNEIQFINYLNICKKNPRVNFAIWTKNPDIIKRVFNKGYEKPENLNIILSSLYINKPANLNKYDFVDKIFTVYDKTTAREKNIEINCGARSCFTCLKCYTKNNTRVINELLK